LAVSVNGPSLPFSFRQPVRGHRDGALTYFKGCFAWAARSRLPEVIQSGRMMKRHLPWILNHPRSRHTNALTEALNARIQDFRYRALGCLAAATSAERSYSTAAISTSSHSKNPEARVGIAGVRRARYGRGPSGFLWLSRGGASGVFAGGILRWSERWRRGVRQMPSPIRSVRASSHCLRRGP
ncbi:transposase, partial [bacterium]|nr:transposase [bacterium]